MHLVVFDLDGTLLNASSEISTYTRETLRMMRKAGIAYTIATGRTYNDCHDILGQSTFSLPQAYKNGVVIWNPDAKRYSHSNFLRLDEIAHVVEAVMHQGLAPFLFTVEQQRHGAYYSPLGTASEEKLAELLRSRPGLEVHPVARLPAGADISNISALGSPVAVDAVAAVVAAEPGLVAYAGTALEGADLKWIDIHHINASKGNAVTVLKELLGLSNVLCFGDSDNDLSMFEIADEAYAPSNAKAPLQQAASKVIGHHDEDGVARFLRERFDL